MGSHNRRVQLKLLRVKVAELSGNMSPAITLCESIESLSGERASYDGAKKRKGSKIHAAVDTLGHLLT